MYRKEKIEAMLLLVNNRRYHVNGMTIFADNFEIINDSLLQFYDKIKIDDTELKMIVTFILLKDIRTIEDITV